MNKLELIQTEFENIFGETHLITNIGGDDHTTLIAIQDRLWSKLEDIFADKVKEVEVLQNELHTKSIKDTAYVKGLEQSRNEYKNSYTQLYDKFYDLQMRFNQMKFVEKEKLEVKVVDKFPDLSDIQAIRFNK